MGYSSIRAPHTCCSCTRCVDLYVVLHNVCLYVVGGVGWEAGCTRTFRSSSLAHTSAHIYTPSSQTWGAFVEESVLAALPSNVRIVWHEATCGGWGLLGWAIETGHLVLEQYAAYVLVTPSMKGPFIPPYYQVWGVL